jgi:plastocyanin
MSLSRYLGIGALFIGFALAATPGCGSSSTTDNTGGSGGATGGSGGSTGGSGGATGGSGGATGGSGGSSFMAVAPCANESDYMAATMIAASGISYTPKCVKVSKGGMVKFAMDFSIHPLKPSATRGNTTDNPIKDTSTGMDATFTFPKAGFFGFFCNVHGMADDGKNMNGVIWVTE